MSIRSLSILSPCAKQQTIKQSPSWALRKRGTHSWTIVLSWIGRQILTWKGPGIFKQAFHWRHHWWYSVRHLSLPMQMHNSYRIWAQTDMRTNPCDPCSAVRCKNSKIAMTPCIWMPLVLKPRRAKHCCAPLLVATSSLINIQILQTVARNINMCNCDEADGKHVFKYHRRAQDQRKLHIVLRWRQLENQRLRRYVDSIERLEIFSFAWMHAMLMWHAQHELWSRSWPMKSEHLGKPTKETAMKRSLKSTFGSYFVESLLRLMQACAQTCGSGPEFQISRWCNVATFCSSHVHRVTRLRPPWPRCRWGLVGGDP